MEIDKAQKSRRVPGTLGAPGRIFLYVQAQLGQTSENLLHDIGELLRQKTARGESPKSGAILSEDFELSTPDGKRFLGVSLRGDLSGWMQIVHEYAVLNHVAVAAVNASQLRVEGGNIYDLDAIEKTSRLKPPKVSNTRGD